MADPKGGRPPELLNRWTRAEETSQAAAQEGQVSPVVEMEREGAGEGVQARPHREGEQDRSMIRIITDLSSKPTQIRRQWNDILKNY